MPLLAETNRVAVTPKEKRLRELRFPGPGGALQCSGRVAGEALKNLTCIRDHGGVTGTCLELVEKSISDMQTLMDLAEANS